MVKCWDLEVNKVIRQYHGHLSGVYALSLHPTLDVLVTSGRDASARVWDMRTKAQIFVLSGHSATVADVKCQDSDPQVITGSMDSTVRCVVSLFLSALFTSLSASGISPRGKPWSRSPTTRNPSAPSPSTPPSTRLHPARLGETISRNGNVPRAPLSSTLRATMRSSIRSRSMPRASFSLGVRGAACMCGRKR